MSFFKTGLGQYAEGDFFMGVSNPQVRGLVKELKNENVGLSDLGNLILHAIHEVCLLGLLLLKELFKKASEIDREEFSEFYLAHIGGN